LSQGGDEAGLKKKMMETVMRNPFSNSSAKLKRKHNRTTIFFHHEELANAGLWTFQSLKGLLEGEKI